MITLPDLWDEPGITPHPALVAAKRPSSREVAEAASVLGWLPTEPTFNAVVPVQQ